MVGDDFVDDGKEVMGCVGVGDFGVVFYDECVIFLKFFLCVFDVFGEGFLDVVGLFVVVIGLNGFELLGCVFVEKCDCVIGLIE